jgi:hypothetical protein
MRLRLMSTGCANTPKREIVRFGAGARRRNQIPDARVAQGFAFLNGARCFSATFSWASA